MLFGLGVDGVVLLYVAHHHALAESRDSEAAIRSLGRPAASMLLGMWTTAATFLGLLVVDFPSLEQLGLLIGLSMVVCGIMTLLLVPASLASGAPRRQPRALTLPGVANFVRHHRTHVLLASAVITVVLGYFATTLRVNLTLDKLRSVTPGARMVEEVTRGFGLPDDVFVVLAEGADLQELLESNEHLAAALRRDAPGLSFQAPSTLLPSAASQAERLTRIQNAVGNVDMVLTRLERTSTQVGFKPQTFEPFARRLPHMVRPDELITFEGFAAHGLQDIIGRFVVSTDGGWAIATYAFPATEREVTGLRSAVAATASGVLTGLQVVNEEMSASFGPQFILGLTVGSLVVLGSIVLTFRDLRLSLLTLVPTAIGLTWAAGLLGLTQMELDLFSVFAVITFVGIGVDYGIHLVHRYQERGDPTAALAELAPVILVAGAITLFGYGTLIGSSYPPLQSIGVVSAVSVVTLVLASVLVLPALLKRKD
jgi:predicted RND superfamily exporter protein